MVKFRYKRVAHLPYSLDLVICDFCLFSRLMDKLAGFYADDNAALL